MKYRLKEGVKSLRKRILVFATALSLSGCTYDSSYLFEGAAIGSGAGAIIGHQSGETAEGAIIGGLAGALLGSQFERGRPQYRYERNWGSSYYRPSYYGRNWSGHDEWRQPFYHRREFIPRHHEWQRHRIR
ncbi:MAG: YMGG-like glycine zipper-containing protein [Nanoarchaeota archaeon]